MILKSKNQLKNDILELYQKINELASDIKLFDNQMEFLEAKASKDYDKCHKRLDILEEKMMVPPTSSEYYDIIDERNSHLYKIIGDLQKQIDYLVTIAQHEDFQVTCDIGHRNDLIMNGYKLLKEETLNVMEDIRDGHLLEHRTVYYLYKEKANV